MAGSYKHATTNKGKLLSPEKMHLDGLSGDAYETIEEMYGMIWWLAERIATDDEDPAAWVEDARQDYQRGIEVSPGVQK